MCFYFLQEILNSVFSFTLTDFGREVPVFRKLYSYAAKDDRPVPNAIFLVNFDKVWFSISILFFWENQFFDF